MAGCGSRGSAVGINRRNNMPPVICQICGAEVPRNAKACPGCGSDEVTGWSEPAAAGDLGLPDEEFDYERFVEEEFGKTGVRAHGLRWFWWVVALGIIATLLAMILGGGW